GLSRLKDGRLATLTSKNGLPCDGVHWMIEDDDHFFWLYTPCGLVRIARSELDRWASSMDKDKNASAMVQSTLFDSADGVRSQFAVGGYVPHVAKSSDGKLWFVTYGGFSVVDPRHLLVNKLPPPVRIEQIIADHKAYDVPPNANGQIRLPPLLRDLRID